MAHQDVLQGRQLLVEGSCLLHCALLGRQQKFAVALRLRLRPTGFALHLKQCLAPGFQIVLGQGQALVLLGQALPQSLPLRGIGKYFLQFAHLHRRMAAIELQKPQVELAALGAKFLLTVQALAGRILLCAAQLAERVVRLFARLAAGCFDAAALGDIPQQGFLLRLGRCATEEPIQFFALGLQTFAHGYEVVLGARQALLGVAQCSGEGIEFLAQLVFAVLAGIQCSAGMLPVVVQVDQSRAEAVVIVLPRGEPRRNRDHFVQVDIQLAASTV